MMAVSGVKFRFLYMSIYRRAPMGIIPIALEVHSYLRQQVSMSLVLKPMHSQPINDLLSTSYKASIYQINEMKSHHQVTMLEEELVDL